MALIYNETTIPNTGIINYNNTDLTKIIYNGTTVWDALKFKYWNHTSGSGTPSATRTFTSQGQWYITQATGWHQSNSSLTVKVGSTNQTVSHTTVASDKMIKRAIYQAEKGTSITTTAGAWANNTSYGNLNLITCRTGSQATWRAGYGSTDSTQATNTYTLTVTANVLIIITGYKSTTTPTVTLAGTTKSAVKTETSGDFRYWIYDFAGTSGQAIKIVQKSNANYGNTISSIYTY